MNLIQTCIVVCMLLGSISVSQSSAGIDDSVKNCEQKKTNISCTNVRSVIKCLLYISTEMTKIMKPKNYEERNNKVNNWMNKMKSCTGERKHTCCFTKFEPTCGNIPELMKCVKAQVNNQTENTALIKEYSRHCDGNLLLTSMNPSGKPCDNFYEYACGAENADQKTLDDMAKEEMEKKIINPVSQILKEAKDDDAPFLKKMKSFYKACMDEKKIEIAGLKSYESYKQDWATVNSKWDSSKFDITKMMIKYEKSFTEGFFKAVVTRCRKESNVYKCIQLLSPTLGLKKEELSEPKQDKIDAYKKLYRNIAMELGAEKDQAEKDANEVVKLEIKLAKLIPPFELPIISHSSPTPKIDYSKVISAMFGPLAQKHYELKDNLDKLDDAIVRYFSNRTIQNFYSFKYAVKFLPETTEKFQKIFNDYSGKQDRKLTCFRNVQRFFPLGLAKIYADHFGTTTDDSKEMLEKIIPSIKFGFKNMINEINWMTDKTKTKLKQKTEKINFHFGYRVTPSGLDKINQLYSMYKINESDYASTFQELSCKKTHELLAQYVLPSDTIKLELGLISPFSFDTALTFSKTKDNKEHCDLTIPAVMMMPPYTSVHYASSLNLAAIGVDIGYKLAEGFSRHLITLDFVEKSEKYRLHHSTDCFTDWYEGAFQASVDSMYRLWKGKSEKKIQKESPLLSFLTPEQQFFLAFGRAKCSHGKKIVNVVKHLTAFSKAFNCPAGAAMNPTKKCSMIKPKKGKVKQNPSGN